ncbi:Uncharacterized HTH-type transcriptional regulator ydfH [uncultured Roseburia sp.]|uniref:GntR family transcriptional regulator n=1 Tax=Brotonthovivens ammoniilytica TaxID=2981725 RepID=A0ABT2TKS3_9FIRM|nr:GntR family transcriptional regulator [Brotonthovivens ammoniilytica]MCU6762808.1 GntR family transcriptional regulator [Brotonthovivens ammoniilytica]SCI89655.1 Uncharacterized HTH-type transcriptional regulator ydfH [uncultured Roseburia sp.]
MNTSEKYTQLKEPSESKQTLAYQQIKEDILNNTYKEGTVMVERKLCDIYNMSRSPIRNALQQLTHEGLLAFIPGKGVVVPEFTTEDILEVYDLIEILQVYAVKSCISKCTDVTLESLHLVLDKMHKSLKEEDIYQCTRWDQKFHELIVDYSSNTRLQNIYAQMNCQHMRFIATILDDLALAERSYQEHMSILKAIEDRNVPLAEEALRLHYQNIKQYYINKLIHRIHI